MQAGNIILQTAESELKNLLRQCLSLNNFQKALSRSEIAEETGIAEATIEKIESGEYDPPLSLLLEILLAQGRTLTVKPYQAFDLVSAKQIGKSLIEKREKEGLTKEDLGKKIGITADDVELLEKWADREKAEELYLVSTAIAPPPKVLRRKLLKKYTNAEIDKASKIVLDALEMLGIVSYTPILPSPKVADTVNQFFNQYGING